MHNIAFGQDAHNRARAVSDKYSITSLFTHMLGGILQPRLSRHDHRRIQRNVTNAMLIGVGVNPRQWR